MLCISNCEIVRTGWDNVVKLDCTSMFGPHKTIATRDKRDVGMDFSWHFISNEPPVFFPGLLGGGTFSP